MNLGVVNPFSNPYGNLMPSTTALTKQPLLSFNISWQKCRFFQEIRLTLQLTLRFTSKTQNLLSCSHDTNKTFFFSDQSHLTKKVDQASSDTITQPACVAFLHYTNTEMEANLIDSTSTPPVKPLFLSCGSSLTVITYLP